MFAEWMVANALYRFVSAAPPERIDWLFDCFVQVPGGQEVLKDMCGFERTSLGFGLACDTSLKIEDRDRGPISEEAFKKTYWGVRPDLRFWASGGAHQLIVELKGRGPNESLDVGQARRYFSYVRERHATGAVVYLVPEWPEAWLQLLQAIVGNDATRFGVIQWNDEFLRPMYSQLIEVIAESLVSAADSLKRALALRPRSAEASSE